MNEPKCSKSFCRNHTPKVTVSRQRVPKVSLLLKHVTTLQFVMNAKLSKHRFWHCHENGLIKTIQTIPHPIGECQVSFPLLRIRINQDKP